MMILQDCHIQYTLVGSVFLCRIILFSFSQQHLTVSQGENKHAIQRAQRWYDATERARGYTMVGAVYIVKIIFCNIK